MTIITPLSRQSNMELLRILAMFLVLLQHATFAPFGYWLNATALQEHLYAHPLSAFGFIITESTTICCVNLFILISGYFGIKLRLQSVLSFLFTIVFFTLGIFLTLSFLGIAPFSFRTIISFLMASLNINAYKSMWFVGAYLVLLFISPLLNQFTQLCSRRKLLLFLLLFYFVQTIFGWMSDLLPVIKTAYFHRGFSWVSFVGLYLLGRYISLYPPRFIIDSTKKRKMRFLTLFGGGCSIVLTSVLFLLCLYFDIGINKVMSAFCSYTSPHTMILTLCIFIFFSMLDIRSKWINWFAASSFTVYFIHNNPAIGSYYLQAIRSIYHTISSPILYAIALVLFFIGVYICSTLLDQIRIWAWRYIGQPIAIRIDKIFVQLYSQL